MLFTENYRLKVDEYGYWSENLALEYGGYENLAPKIKNQSYDSHFEHVIDIISTYSDEQKRILLGILA